MANDVVRGMGNLDNFASGFDDHLKQIGIAAVEFATCSGIKWVDFSREIQSIVKQTNDSFAAYCKEYQLLSCDVKANRKIKAYQLFVGDASEQYVRWVIHLLTDRFYISTYLWRLENSLQHWVHISFLGCPWLVSV